MDCNIAVPNGYFFEIGDKVQALQSNPKILDTGGKIRTPRKPTKEEIANAIKSLKIKYGK
ncbi:MAG: hypothetical protein FWC51_04825 [Proteobacteria bacterium]|nr:hypothetical protein [Pseudomonadota bacterium]